MVSAASVVSPAATLQVSEPVSPVFCWSSCSTSRACPLVSSRWVRKASARTGLEAFSTRVGQGSGDLVLHVESLLEVGDVEAAEIFDVCGKELHDGFSCRVLPGRSVQACGGARWLVIAVGAVA